MATLQEIEAKIEACKALTWVCYGEEDLDGVVREITGAEAAVTGLYEAWATLRRILWSRPYQEWADRLKGECRETLMRLSAEHRLAYFGEPDRWPATATAPAVH